MKSKVRVLYALEAADAGALKHLTYLTTNLDRNLFEITVILSPNRSERVYPAVAKMKDCGAQVILVPMTRNLNPLRDVAALCRLYTILNKGSYDLIHAHSSKAGFLLRLLNMFFKRKPIVYTPHCFFYESKRGAARFFFALAERLLASVTDHIVVSDNERESALKNKIANAGKLRNINNAIDFKEYRFTTDKNIAKNSLGIQPGTIVIGAVGRLTEQKDWRTYLYAAALTVKRYPNAIFLIVGDGEQRKILQNHIDVLNLQDHVMLTGHQADVGRYFSAMDVFVSTSLWEGLPYTLLEAMFFKKPVVATDVGYAGMINHEQTGFLIPVRDYRLLATRIMQLIGNKALGEEMGETAHELMHSRFSFRQFVTQHEQLYLSIGYSK